MQCGLTAHLYRTLHSIGALRPHLWRFKTGSSHESLRETGVEGVYCSAAAKQMPCPSRSDNERSQGQSGLQSGIFSDVGIHRGSLAADRSCFLVSCLILGWASARETLLSERSKPD